MDEYISREALLAEIAADYGNWIVCNDTDESYRQGVKDNYSDTIRLINDIPAADMQPVNQWISVMDRLPENAKPCAVVTEDNGLGVSRYMGRNRFEWTLFGKRVLYWMSLPEPPKDGDAE